MGSRVREAIVECLKEVGTNNENESQVALQTLVTITRVSPQNRNLLSQTDGAVAELVNLAKSASPTSVQILALSILFNLSLNPNLKSSLADIDNITHLHTVILSTSEESVKLAASLLCSLAMLDRNKAKFGVAGTIQVLVKAISSGRSPATHYLLSSLAELVHFHGNCTMAVRSGAIPVLVALAESADGEDLSGTSLIILGLLARFEEGLNELKKTDGIVARMVGVLKRRCMQSKEGACEILMRLFDESETCMKEAMRLPEFTSVVADISIRASGKTREKAGLLMKKMMDPNLY
ncbi:U-box domain-containing protein 14-like [Dorcoceras hygrometricum]|uniref:U-box domain-containing protein 14-like n=1 Tax=Dorcoceras hygrometricum TaxID=472368 RepID=A0A2Z7BHP9_9LAMI|nr:U-box domain-containing protein 14-like [Dorcoceras hygrometricum]